MPEVAGVSENRAQKHGELAESRLRVDCLV